MTAPIENSPDWNDATMAMLLRFGSPRPATGFLARVPWDLRS
jgi:hypothetical protein